MAEEGGFEVGEEIISWSWKLIVLLIVVAYVYFHILSYVNVADETKEVLFESFVTRARGCIEQGLKIEECFQNPIGKYGVKLDNNAINAGMFEKCNKEGYICKEKEFYAEYNNEVKKHKFEVVYTE